MSLNSFLCIKIHARVLTKKIQTISVESKSPLNITQENHQQPSKAREQINIIDLHVECIVLWEAVSGQY